MAGKAPEPLKRISVFLAQRQIEGLQTVHEQTHIPVAVLIRQGVDYVLAQHGINRPATRRAKR